MITILIIGAAFVGVACLVGGVATGLKTHGLIREQPVGLKAVENLAGGFRGFPERVEVFDPDQPLTALAFRLKVAGQCGDQ